MSASSAQNAQLWAPDRILTPDQVAVVSLSLTSADQALAAIQFDLQWDPPLNVQFTPGDQLRAASKVPYFASSPGSLRCLIAGFNQTSIGDGELLKLFLSISSAPIAGTAQIRIVNLVATDAGGTEVAVDAVPVNIQLQGGAGVPTLSTSAVLNAASVSPGPLSPGEIITVLGIHSPPDVSLRIDDLPAPILYAGANQINAVVPFALDPTSPASVVMMEGDQQSLLLLPAAAASPAIFTAGGAGIGPGAILNEDYSPNAYDRPARPGSVVMVYGTGFGTLQAPVADGQIIDKVNNTAAPVTATVAGAAAEVVYAGSAPGLMAGVIQINIRLPADVIHNPVAPLVLSVSGSTIPSGVSVAIE